MDTEEANSSSNSLVIVNWKPFHNNDDLYLIKIQKNNNYEILLNDLKSIWVQNVSENYILELFQQMNPMLDVKVEDGISQVINLVSNITDSSEIKIQKSLDTIQLELYSKAAGFEYGFRFDFSKSSADMFLQETTVPLIQTVKCLEEQQKLLCNLLKRKEREIEEYKLEKGEISRSDLVTERFDEKEITTNDNRLMLNIFASSQSFWEQFTKQHGDVVSNLPDVKSDPWNYTRRKRKIYSSKTVKKKGAGVKYTNL